MVTRRTALAAGLAVAAPAALLGRPALAQGGAYPNRTIRLVVPFTPAGTTDIAARILAERLTQRFGQQVVVENRAGAGGNVGSDFVAKSDPDGYSLLMCTISSGAINYGLYGARMPYKPEDLAAAGLLLKVPNAIFVTNALPVRTLRELVDYVKARPGQLNHGSSGVGTSLHLTGELLKTTAGLQMTHVPYRGSGPMLQEVIAGRIEVAVDNLPSVIGHIRDGRLRALAVTTSERSPVLPDVPTTAEAGLTDYAAEAWFGLFAQAATPPEIIARYAREAEAVLAEPAVANRALEAGAFARFENPATLKARVERETASWTELVKAAGIKPD